MQVSMVKVLATTEPRARRGAEFKAKQTGLSDKPECLGLTPLYRPRPTALPHVYIWLAVVRVS